MSRRDRAADPPGSVRFEPARRGLAAMMGPLEAQVMDALWAAGEASVREVWETLGGEPRVAYTTVLTILQRLHEKGVLDRRSESRAHVYRPRCSREDFQGGVLTRVLEGVLGQLRASQTLGVMGRLSRRDRELLRQLLDEAEGGS